MKKAVFFLSVLIIIILFSGCTKIPEKTDIEGLIEEISDEIANQCGNSLINEWEECDFKNIQPCSRYDIERIGPITCEECSLDFSNCQLKESCNVSKCNSKGECKENKYIGYEIFCDCFDNRTGEHCEYCSEYFHFDFDRECISDSICTEIGCELENQECFIDGKRSKCRCKHPWTGEKCDECIEGFFKKDDLCATDNCSLIKCFDYEKCDNSSGVAVCVCISDTQDSNDCSKCLYGYDWDSSSPERCINKKTVNCIPPNFRKLPENAEVITSTHELYYTPESGWTNAPECAWQCKQGYVLYKNSCTDPLLKKVYDAGVPFGIDKNGYLITGNEYGEIYFFSNNQEPNLLANTGLKFVRGLIGGDGNIYFGTSWNGRGVFDTDSHKFIYLNVGTNKDNMSILQNGTVVFGSDYLDFPVFKEIDQNNPNQRAATISDEQGNILTIYNNGTVIFNDKDWNLIWKKQFDSYFFGDYPVLDKKGRAYLPYCAKNGSDAGVITIELSDGSMAKKQIDFTEGNCNESFTPAISIGNNDKKYVVYRGVLRIYDENNILLTDTKDIDIDYYLWGINIPPVITDKNEIYFGYDEYVFCVNEFGELNWAKNIDYSINTIIHYDNRLFVFNSVQDLYIYTAQGNLSGDWPQIKHDTRMSASLTEIQSLQKPKMVELISPDSGENIRSETITFQWSLDSANPENEFVLTLPFEQYDKVYAGPEKFLDSFTAENLPINDDLRWKVAAKGQNGAISINENFFVRTSPREIWRFDSDKKFLRIHPTINNEGNILAARADDLIFVNSSLNTSFTFKTSTSYYQGSAVDNNGNFMGFSGRSFFKISDSGVQSEIDFETGSYIYTIPAIDSCSGRMLSLIGNIPAYKTGFGNEPERIYPYFQESSWDNPIVNKRGVLYSDEIFSIFGNYIREFNCLPWLIFDDYIVCNGYDNTLFALKDDYPEILNSKINLKGGFPVAVSKGKIITTYYEKPTCSFLSGVPDQAVWDTVFEWACDSKPSDIAISSDGTIFAISDKNMLVIKEGVGIIWNEPISNESLFGVTLTEEGRLFVMTENKIMEIEHNADGANPFEWSQYRGNSRRTGSLEYDSCNTHAKIILQEPSLYSEISDKTPLFKWEATDLENDPIKYDFKLYLDSVLVFENLDITEKSIQLPIELESGEQYTWSVTAKDGEQGNNKATSYFNTK